MNAIPAFVQPLFDLLNLPEWLQFVVWTAATAVMMFLTIIIFMAFLNMVGYKCVYKLRL